LAAKGKELPTALVKKDITKITVTEAAGK